MVLKLAANLKDVDFCSRSAADAADLRLVQIGGNEVTLIMASEKCP